MTSILLCDGNANGQRVDVKSAAEGDTIEVAGSRYTISRWAGDTELVGFCDEVDLPTDKVLGS